MDLDTYSQRLAKHPVKEYVRIVAVETVGKLIGEIPRHKKSLVRLLKEDPSMEAS